MVYALSEDALYAFAPDSKQQNELFVIPTTQKEAQGARETTERLPRLDLDSEIRAKILPLCRLREGEIWQDSISGHRVGVLDATRRADVEKIMRGEKARLVLNDPPYNVQVGNANTTNLSKIDLGAYVAFARALARN